MKRCSKCKELKLCSEFYKDATRRDSLTCWCKACVREYDQSERGRAAQKRYRESEKGRMILRPMKRCYNTSEKGRAASKRYRQSEKRRIALKRYEQSEKGRMARQRINAKRRAFLRGAEATLTAEEWLALVEDFACCPLCGREFGPALPMTMDHIIPLSRGGTHTIKNVQPLCKPCNSSKGNRV